MEAQVQAAAPAVVDRKAARAAALEHATKVAAQDGETSTDEAVEALRAMVAAFSPATRASAGPRELLEKAEPSVVKAYFESTGLTRKELAAAAGVSTSVIATVQNENGDRWSTTTFEAKKAMIAKWTKAHAKEIKARQDGEARDAAARQAAIDAKAQARAAREAKANAPKPASLPRAKAATAKASTAKAKPRRQNAAARAAGRQKATA